MSVIATDTPRLSNWLKHEYEPSSGYCREAFEVDTETHEGLVTGTVLDSAFVPVVLATIADASYILIDDITSSAYVNGDFKQATVLARGPAKVGALGLVIDSSVVLEASFQTIYDALAAKGIMVDPQI